VKLFTCPSDSDATSQANIAGLSYSANTGAWDRDASGNFLYNPGDGKENGVFFNLADYARNGAQGPKVSSGNITDGASTTIMFAENRHKTYEPLSGTTPAFSWLGIPQGKDPSEQQLGIVWVATATPAVSGGSKLLNQESINGNVSDLVVFPTDIPLYARPSSAHGSGANVAFCDGSCKFIRQDISYIVYQQLMTPNGRKSFDPTNNGDMKPFHEAPPLTESDYQ
jgi:prepilin-type processing-associated H-X9-DG protein